MIGIYHFKPEAWNLDDFIFIFKRLCRSELWENKESFNSLKRLTTNNKINIFSFVVNLDLITLEQMKFLETILIIME